MNSTERPRVRLREAAKRLLRGRLSLSIGRPTQSTLPPQRRRSSRLMPKRRRASPRRPPGPAPQACEDQGRGRYCIRCRHQRQHGPCIDALRKNIEAFIDSLSQGGPNNAAPVRDWRGKVVGFRDIEAAQGEGLPWIMDNSFVTDANALKAQLAALDAAGGGDEPEVAARRLYKVASMEATPKGAQSVDPGKWRYRAMRRAS